MIFIEDSEIKIGGVILPGLFKSIEIKSSVKMEEQEVEGNSNKPKQATGYEDAKVTIELILGDTQNQTKEDKLQIIQNLFRNPSENKPRVYDLFNKHTSIRDIRKVIFSDLSTKEDNKLNQISVNIELVQYDTMTITATKSTKDTSNNRSKTTTNNNTKQSTNKTSKTPAKDTAKAKVK